MSGKLDKELEEDVTNTVLADDADLSEGLKKEAEQVDTKDEKGEKKKDADKSKDEDGEDDDNLDTDKVKEAYQDRDQPKVQDGPASEKEVPATKGGKSTDDPYIDGEDPEKVMPGKRDAKDTAKPYISGTAILAKESIEKMFEGADSLSPEFIERAATIFEAAFNSKIKEAVVAIEEEKTAEFEENFANLEEELREKTDVYLSHVAKEWVEENKIEVQKGIKQNIAEDFLKDFKGLLEAHNITIPDDKLDLYEQAQVDIEELKAEVSKLTEKVIEKDAVIFEHEKSDALNAIAEGLADTQVEKLKSLVEDVEAKDIETFSKKAKDIRESFFKESKEKTNDDGEKVELSEDAIEDAESPKKVSAVSRYIQSARETNLR